MAWASKKQYAILMSSEEGKDLAEQLPDMEQDAFNDAFSKLLGKGGSGAGMTESKSKEKSVKSVKDNKDRKNNISNDLMDIYESSSEIDAEESDRNKRIHKGAFERLKEKYPDITKEELLEALNDSASGSNDEARGVAESMFKENEQPKKSNWYDRYDDNYKNQLLGRMKSDNDYFLGNGNRNEKHLWSGNKKQQIDDMRSLLGSMKEKPDWISENDINDYERKMNDENYGKENILEKYTDSDGSKYYITDDGNGEFTNHYGSASTTHNSLEEARDTMKRLRNSAVLENDEKHYLDTLDLNNDDKYAKLYREKALKVDSNRARNIASALKDYSDEATRGFITRAQLDKYGKRLGLDKLSDNDLSQMWEDVHNVSNYLANSQRKDEDMFALMDAASAFSEVVNEEARNRRKNK